MKKLFLVFYREKENHCNQHQGNDPKGNHTEFPIEQIPSLQVFLNIFLFGLGNTQFSIETIPLFLVYTSSLCYLLIMNKAITNLG